MRSLILSLIVVFSTSCFAVTWVETKVDDPIRSGNKCDVQEPASYGSYIYQWPSKYELVFWPFTDRKGIWFCEKSGYVSFMVDFNQLTTDEKGKIKTYLKKNKLKKPSTEQLLGALEAIYELRDFEPQNRNQLDRVFARWYEMLGDHNKTQEYRKKSYDDIVRSLQTELTKNTKLEYLFLAANYARWFGEIEKSDGFLLALNTEIDSVFDSELSGYAEYLKELSTQTQFITPGNKIEPELDNKKH